MKEDEFVSKVGWREKGLSGKRGPREQMWSPNALVHLSASVGQRCERLEGQTQRPQGQGGWLAVPGRATLESKQKENSVVLTLF